MSEAVEHRQEREPTFQRAACGGQSCDRRREVAGSRKKLGRESAKNAAMLHARFSDIPMFCIKLLNVITFLPLDFLWKREKGPNFICECEAVGTRGEAERS